jgi:hypothetical protein
MTELSRYCASYSISEKAREAFSPAVDIFAVEIFISTNGRNLSVNQPLRELRAFVVSNQNHSTLLTPTARPQ